MDIDQFWQIIEATRAATQDEQLDKFRGELKRLRPDDLIQFEHDFVEREFAAYSWDLWVVAWLCQGGRCSDDGFSDFRRWLISRGRAIYEAAIADADALFDEMRHTEDPAFELFGYIPGEIYRTMTGGEFPELGFQHPREPLGGDWLPPELKNRNGRKLLNRCVVFYEMEDQEYAAIERRFPRIWELCVQRGIITTGARAAPSTIPTPEEVAATVDPNLEKTDFPAYFKALGDAARQAYKPKD